MEAKQFFQTMLKKWWLFLIVVLATMGAVVYLTDIQTPIYEAKVTYITKLSDTIESRDIASAVISLNRDTDILPTYSEVSMSQMVTSMAAQRLGLSPGEQRNLTVRSRVITGTTILEIAVEGENPSLVRDFANVVGEETATYTNSLYATYRLERLDQAQAPGQPISPRKNLNLIIGGLLSLVLGVGAVLVSSWMGGALRSSNRNEPANMQLILSLQKELEDIKKESVYVRQELHVSGQLIRDTRSETRLLLTTLAKISSHLNGQKDK